MSLETPRLRIRPLEERDAEFIVRLLNEPAFLRFIGDRSVRTEADALGYISRAREHQARAGFGLGLVERKADAGAVGIAGVMQKPWLDAPDLAYAFLTGAAGQGYATEAAGAVLEDAIARMGLSRVVAVVTPDNAASIRVLEKLRFGYSGTVLEPSRGDSLLLFSRSVEARAATGPVATSGRP